MDEHIKELFEAAQHFEDGDLTLHPDYERYNGIVLNLKSMMDECFGGEVAQLMHEYVRAHFEMERFECLHYFYQGYLAAREESK